MLWGQHGNADVGIRVFYSQLIITSHLYNYDENAAMKTQRNLV